MRTRDNHLYRAMKTIEQNNTGLPSFEAEWPGKGETERASDETNWASERLQQMLETSLWEQSWRGFQGYDSPLAG